MKDYPVIKFGLLFIAGILLHKIFNFNLIFIFFSQVILLLLLVLTSKYLSRRNNIFIFLFASLSVVNIGALTAVINKTEYTDFPDTFEREKNVTIFGEVKKIDLPRDYEINLLIDTDSLKFHNYSLKINCELYLKIRDDRTVMDSLYELLKPGNNISAEGIFSKGRGQRNPGEFDFSDYLHSIGISGSIVTYNASSVKIMNDRINYFNNAIHQFRKLLDSRIDLIHLPLSAGFIKGLLLADRSEIDYDTKTEFINTGVVHVLAVSGLHVGYIALIFLICFGRFNLYLRSMLTLSGLVFFMFLTNSPDSVIRAVIMSAVIIIAFVSNRTTNIFNSLAIAALALLVFKPNDLFSPSFQLSFGAVLGIASVTPSVSEYINSLNLKSKFLRYLFLFFAVSFGAQLGTLPMTMYYFGKVSIVAFLANLIVIPAVGVVVAISIITLAISPVSISVAAVYAFVNDYLILALFKIIKFFGGLEFSFARINQFSVLNAVILSVFIFLMIFFWEKFHSRLSKMILIILAVLNIIIYSKVDDKDMLPADVLTIIMIDVGQGDAFLIKFPDGSTALIDAGDADQYFDNGERVILPLLDYFGIEKINYGFVSHIDSDHYGGFVSLIEQNKIKSVFKPQLDSTLEKDIRFEKFLHQKKIPVTYYQKKYLTIGNARFYILNNPMSRNYSTLSTNDKSGIFKLVYGNSSFLFTGDLEAAGENYFSDEYSNFLRSDVLKVGHHGSNTSTSDNFLTYVAPKISLVSVGLKNKFGHPSKEVLKLLKNFNSKILRTDLAGASIIESDGKSISIVDWK